VPRELADFTPFGYLRNPAHRARSWADTQGGNVRTATDYLGLEWAYPVGRDPTSRAGIGLETTLNGRTCRTRADFEAIGLTSRYHTSSIVGFDWRADGVEVEARFFLLEADALCLRLSVRNDAMDARRVEVGVVEHVEGSSLQPHALQRSTATPMDLAAGEARTAYTLLTRDRAAPAMDTAETAYQRLLAEDRAFAETCPTLSGDWPAHWPEGLHHDFQTTRLLVQPPGGIFRDVWPAWMAAWPRVVLAEGTLDMLRLAYADPALASRAVLSLFRDAPQPNVPCVFAGGAYNMVAADGSRCGTSPAWCLPFLNLELLYLRTLDRSWLAQVYPYAAGYLEWWLEHRVDAEGWLVYKCTWESGEDGNPRLDPGGSGDGDISARLRPVELQATLAHAAGVMAFFASELGLPELRWRGLREDYRGRTRHLFDAASGRYRDWLIAEGRFQAPCPERPYWGLDTCRYSVQSLTPLLIGQALDEDEIWRHACAPWTLWPSWTWSLVESAAAAGHYARLGGLVFETIDRVYRVTTRRDVAGLARPMPGSAPEFWPEDWRSYGGSDAYGWGATTANLVIRHLFGFKESRQTDGWVAELTPALPSAFRKLGARYTIRRMTYRGLRFDLSYTVRGDDLLVELNLEGDPRPLRVERLDRHGDVVHADAAPESRSHGFQAQVGERYRVRL
jgi:hypothetical protein